MMVTGTAAAQFATTCDGATGAPVGAGTHAFDLRTIAAANGTDGVFCGGGSHQFEKWLAYVPGVTGRVLMKFSNLSGGPATYSTVYDFGSGGTCEFQSLSDLCQVSDDPCRPNGANLVYVNAGVPVLIRVSGVVASKPFGNLVINEAPVGPAGDVCSSAQSAVLGVNAFSTAGSLVDGLPPGSGFASDTWFVYTPAADGGIEASVCTQPADTAVALFGACDVTSVLDTGSFNDVDSRPCRARAGVRAGVPVYIQIAQQCGGSGQFTLTFIPNAIPSNDVCASATAAVLGNNRGDNTFAFTDGGDDCSGDFASGRNVWFRFTPAVSGNYDLRVGYDFDTIDLAIGTSALAVFASCAATNPAGPITIACSNEGFSSSFVRTGLTAGTQYFIRVAGAGRPIDGTAFGRGEFNLNIRRVVPPANDSCANALTVGPGTYAFDLLDATADGSRRCSNLDPIPDVWFVHTPTVTGPLEIGMVQATNTPIIDLSNAEITIGADCFGGNPTTEAATFVDTTTGARLSRLLVQGTAGTPIRIRVAAETRPPFAAAGELYIGAVRSPAPPANDSCETAQLITGTTAFTVANSTIEPPACGDAPTCQTDACTTASDGDVFFRYVATRTGMTDIRVDDGEPYFANDTYGAGAIISVLNACGSAPVECALPCGDFPADKLTMMMNAGQSYIIRIGRYGFAPFWATQGGTISIGCPADFDGNGSRTIDDIFIFINAWFAGDPRTDVNGDGRNIDDIFIFINTWFAGC